MINFNMKNEDKHKKNDDKFNEHEKKCYPKRGNSQAPYQKIEFQIRQDAHFWPPITPNAPQNGPSSEIITKSNNHNSRNLIKELTINESNETNSPILTNGKLKMIDKNNNNSNIIDPSDVQTEEEDYKQMMNGNSKFKQVDLDHIEMTNFSKV